MMDFLAAVLALTTIFLISRNATHKNRWRDEQVRASRMTNLLLESDRLISDYARSLELRDKALIAMAGKLRVVHFQLRARTARAIRPVNEAA